MHVLTSTVLYEVSFLYLFTNGDYCEPINTGRSTSIQFLRPENGDVIDCTNLVAESVEETSECVYEMTVRISEECCDTYLTAFPP